MKHALNLAAVETAVRAEVVPLGAIPADWDHAWDNLAEHAGEPNPFAERWFMRPAIEHLNCHAHDRMIAVWQASALLGLLPVTIAPNYGRQPVRHVENWLHYHCFYGAPLTRAGDELAFWSAALASLDTADWAPNFFHLVCVNESGPAFTSLGKARRADIVHRSERAMLRSTLNAETYFTTHIRQKKRKELRRLRSRLDELGTVAFDQLEADGPVDAWIADFLALEASGWKGREGSALSGTPQTKIFFEQAIRGAHAADKLDILRMTIDGKPIAMLVNLMAAPGGFAFKIAFDEDYARFSPGVLIKIENLKALNNPEIDWIDSCAVGDHPMINSLWAERRSIVRVTIPLAGARRQAAFHAARTVETVAARLRGRS